MRNINPVTFLVLAFFGLFAGQSIFASTITLEKEIFNRNTLKLDSTITAIDVAITNSNCGDSISYAASVSVVGGIPPFSYAWSTGDMASTVQDLALGIHSVTVTDSTNCVAIDTFFVQAIPSLIVNKDTIINPSCQGIANGRISVNVSGGTPNYSFAWSNGADGPLLNDLEAGTYILTVTDANGCSVVDTTIVTPVLELAATISETLSATGPMTPNGAATVEVSGGQAPYTYLWDNGMTTQTNITLIAGAHSVTITDSDGCNAVIDFTISFSELNVEIDVSRDARCNGGSDGFVSVLTSDGISPYTYAWSTGDTTRITRGLSAGTYSVTVTDVTGLTGEREVTIGEGDPIAFNATIIHPTCATTSDGMVRMSATGGREPYLYDIGIGLTPVGIISGIRQGEKRYRVFSADGCVADTTFTMVALSQGVPTADFEVIQNGLSGIITNTSTGEPNSFVWQFGEGTATTLPNPGIVNYPDTGAYTICLTATNHCGSNETCKDLMLVRGQVPGVSIELGADTASLAGTNIQIPITAGVFNDLQGIQGTFSFSDPTVATIVGVGNFALPGLDSTHITIQDDLFTVDWTNPTDTGVSISAGTILFTLDINITGEPGECTQLLGNSDILNLDFSSLFEGEVVSAPLSINSPEICVSRLVSITGNVSREASEGVAGVFLDINSDDEFVTDETGNYSFPDLSSGATFSITPNKPGELLVGVSTLDLVRILQHILISNPLESPYRIIAADIDNSGSVNSLDLVYLQQAILGKRTDFPNNRSWRFVPENYTFENPRDPLAESFPESLVLNKVDEDELNADFVAIKVGDVTPTTANKRAANKQPATFKISTPNQTFKKGELINIPFTLSEQEQLLAWQMKLDFDPSILAYQGLVDGNYIGLSSLNIGEEEASIKMLWLNTTAMAIGKAKKGHFTLQFIAKKDGVLSTNIQLASKQFSAEVYSDNNGAIATQNVVLDIEETTEHFFIAEETLVRPSQFLMSGEAGSCGDGVDNDGDGLIDCADADCFCECNDPDNNGCFDPCESFFVAIQTIPICGEGALAGFNINASGGSGNYTYVVNDSIYPSGALSNLPIGTYIVAVHDSLGCSSIDTMIVESLRTIPQFTFTLDGGALFVEDQSNNNPNTWAWTFGNFATSTSASQNVNITDILDPFEICLTTNNACGVGVSCQNFDLSMLETDTTTMGIDTTMLEMDTTTMVMDTTMVEMDTTTMEMDTTMVEMDTTTMEMDTTMVEMDTTTMGIDTTMLEMDTTTMEMDTTMLEMDTTMMEMDTTMMEMDTTMMEMDTTMMEMDTTILEIDTTTMEVDTTIVNQEININAITRDAECQEDNGSIVVSVSGGTPPYTYNWDNPDLSGAFVTALPDGNYMLTVTDAIGNSSVASLTINKETVDIDRPNTVFVPDCVGDEVANGSLQLAAIGGTAPYRYLLNDTESIDGIYTGLTSGGYLLTIQDSIGCAAIYTIELPGISIAPAFTFVQNETTIEFTDISSNTPDSWSWTFATAGTSDLQNPQLDISTVTESFEACLTTTNLCGTGMVCQTILIGDTTIVDTIAVTPIDTTATLVIDLMTTAVSCNGGDGMISASVMGGTSPYAYNWSDSTLTGSSATNLSVGSYMLTVTDANGSQAIAIAEVTMSTSVSFDAANSQIRPSCSETDMGTGSLQIVGAGGMEPYSYDLNGSVNTTGTFAGLFAGVYSLTIQDANGCSSVDMINIPSTDATPQFTLIQSLNELLVTDISNNQPDSWSWTFGNVATSSSSSQALNTSSIPAGPFEVCLTTTNACGTAVSCETVLIEGIPSDTTDMVVDTTGMTIDTTDMVVDTTGMTMDTTDMVVDTTGMAIDTTDMVVDTTGMTIDTMDMEIDTMTQSLAISLTKSDVSCTGTGGSIMATATGGTAPYSYVWNVSSIIGNSGSNLGVGGYTITVTDATGMTATATSVIGTEAGVVYDRTASTIIPSCDTDTSGTGSITVVGTGGTAPYSYDLNGGLSMTGVYTGLFAGTYFLSIEDAEGCSSLDTIMIPVGDATPSFIAVQGESEITFTDVSTNNPTSWAWTFGNIATSTSATQVLNITGVEGPLEVCLTTSNDCGSGTFCETFIIGMDVDTTDMEIDTTGMVIDTTDMEIDTTGMEIDTTDMEIDTTVVDRNLVQLSIENIAKVTTDTISLAVSAANFENVLSLQYSIQITDTTQAKIIGVQGFNLEGLSASNFHQVNDYSLSAVWFDATAMGLSVPNETVLYSVQLLRSNREADCIQLEINGNVIPLQVILAIEDSLVEGSLDISNGSACTSESRSIFGNIMKENGEPVADVMVSISNEESLATTGADGFYSFNQVALTENFDIIPSKLGNHLEDVSTFDIVLMNRHILMLSPLDSPYKIIAADINRSNSITVFDLVLVQRRILGLNQDFPGNTSWRFIPASFEFADPANPFAEPFPELIAVDGFSGDLGNQDFIGIKVGDVSYFLSETPLQGTAGSRSSNSLELAITNQIYEKGSTLSVPVSAANLTSFSGFQMELNFDPTTLQLTDIISDNGIQLAEHNISYRYLEQGKVLLSWVAPEVIASDEVLFDLVFKAQKAGDLKDQISLSHTYLTSEAYTEDLQISKIDLTTVDQAAPIKAAIEIYPNPTTGIFDVRVPATLLSPKEILIYNITGQEVQALRDLDHPAQQYVIDLSQHPEGTYLVLIKGERVVEMRRVVISK